MNSKNYSLLIFIILFVTMIPQVSGDQHQVLLIYGNEEERQVIESSLDRFALNYTSISITNLVASDINDQDLVIFVSSEDFSTDDAEEASLLNYVQNENHNLLVISPYIEEFSDDLEEAIGIEGVDEITEDDNQQWTITLSEVVGNYTPGQELGYSGVSSLITLNSNANLIGSFTDASGDLEDVEDLELPRPAIWNVTTSAYIHVMPMTIDQGASLLSIDQVPVPFMTFVEEFIQIIAQKVISIPTGTTQSSTDTVLTDDTSTNQDSSGLNLPSLDIVYALIALIVILLAQVLGILRWLINKGYGALFFVIGAFYNISDRTLSHNEVVMNIARNEILAYLNHVGSYGAHLREIKNITGLGSGSLLWHLQMLEDYQFIVKYSVGSFTVFVAENYHFDPQLKIVELDLQSKYTLDIIAKLSHLDQNLVTLSHIQEETGISRRAIRRILKKLQNHNIISVEKYPEMSIIIEQNNILRDLFHSFQLRANFIQILETPEIQQL